MNLIIRWIIISLSLFAATWIVPGIHIEGNAWLVFAVMAIILGLANALIRPILKFLSCPIIILTFGLFTFVINGFVLWLSSIIAVRWLKIGFHIDSFWSAVLGSVIVSVVSFILNLLLREKDEPSL